MVENERRSKKENIGGWTKNRCSAMSAYVSAGATLRHCGNWRKQGSPSCKSRPGSSAVIIQHADILECRLAHIQVKYIQDLQLVRPSSLPETYPNRMTHLPLLNFSKRRSEPILAKRKLHSSTTARVEGYALAFILTTA